jgi:hypothetical protein
MRSYKKIMMSFLCSHEKLMDSYLMLEIVHEVMVTSVKLYQPHTHKFHICYHVLIIVALKKANLALSM